MIGLIRVVPQVLALSAVGLIAIAVTEAWRDTTYLPTKDDVPTIGFGHTGEAAKPGAKIPVERGLILLANDVSKTETRLRECINVPLYQHEWDAYVSWAFNVGADAACKSTLVRKLHAGDYAGACAELSRWVYQGKTVLPGLVKRRAEERARCEGKQ